MKWTITILFIFIQSNFCFSQEAKIGIVDIDSIVNSIVEESKLDSLHIINEENYFKLGEDWVEKFKDKVDTSEKNMKMWCDISRNYEEINKKFEALQSDIVAFEKFYIDTFPIFKEQLIEKIDSLLVSEYQKLRIEKGYSFIIRKNQLLYFKDEDSLEMYKVKDKVIYQRRVEDFIYNYQKLVSKKHDEYLLKIKEDYF